MTSIPPQIWMLFESGNSVGVHLDLYPPPKGSNRPVDAYVVTESAGDFTTSARRAAEVVYGILRQRQVAMEPVVAAFDLPGLARSGRGESGGLAFALALALRLLDRDHGPVAATGAIVSSHCPGLIGPVLGAAAKIAAAAELVPPGGWIFYPAANAAEIDEKTRTELQQRGIRLMAVESVSQALAAYFQWNPADSVQRQGPASKTRPGRAVFWLLLVAGLSAAAAGRYYSPHVTAPPKPAAAVFPATRKQGPVGPRTDSGQDFFSPGLSWNMEYSFSSNGELAVELARLLQADLSSSLLTEAARHQKLRALFSARLEISSITEEMNQATGELESTLTVALAASELAGPKGRQILAEREEIMVQGSGPASELLPQAAAKLATAVRKSLVRVLPDPGKAADFE